MTFRKLMIGAAALLLLAYGWRSFGWPGIALVVGGGVMWVLLNFTRLMKVMERAAKRPLGHVDSAVMLNAKLKKGLSLLQVVALTRSLGLQQSAKDAQPEVFRWQDAGQSYLEAEFAGGRLRAWQLVRPAAEPDSAPVSDVAAALPAPRAQGDGS